MTVTHDENGVEVRLKDLSSEELFILSIFAKPRERLAIQHEIERRAVNAEIRSMLDMPGVRTEMAAC